MATAKRLPTEVNGVKIVSDCGLGFLHANSKNKVRIVIVECADCKEARKVNYYSLKNSGAGKYCNGCSSKGERNGGYKHGAYADVGGNRKTRTNAIWSGMKARCSNPNDKEFKNYGAIGITVCNEWLEYVNFEQWANGRLEDVNSSLERKDTSIGYEPANVMIMPTYLQAYNRRNGMDMKTAIAFAKAFKEHGKVTGYTMFYMNMFPTLKDYQVKNFVLYSKHIDELSKLEIT